MPRSTAQAIYCGNCRYDVRGLPGTICPECGSDLLIVGVSDRAKARSKWAIAGLVLYAAAALLGPLLLAPWFVEHAIPFTWTDDQDVHAAYGALAEPPLLGLEMTATARQLRWQWPIGALIQPPAERALRIRFDDGSQDAQGEISPWLELHVDGSGLSMQDRPELSESELKEILVQRILLVSEMPPEKAREVADDLLSWLAQSSKSDAWNWRAAPGTESSLANDTDRWWSRSTSRSSHRAGNDAGVLIALLLIPVAWWLLLFHVPGRIRRRASAFRHEPVT